MLSAKMTMKLRILTVLHQRKFAECKACADQSVIADSPHSLATKVLDLSRRAAVGADG